MRWMCMLQTLLPVARKGDVGVEWGGGEVAIDSHFVHGRGEDLWVEMI